MCRNPTSLLWITMTLMTILQSSVAKVIKHAEIKHQEVSVDSRSGSNANSRYVQGSTPLSEGVSMKLAL